MKKVLHVTTVHHRADVRIFWKECCSLIDVGFQVNLLVQDGLGSGVVNGVQVMDIGKKYTSRITRIIGAPWRMFFFAKKFKPDVIHFHDPECLVAGYFLKILGFSVIYDAHEDVPRQIATKHWIPKWLRFYLAKFFETLENFIAARIDAVVCATDVIRDRFLKVNKKSLDVKNYPLLSEFMHVPLEKPKNRTVCYLGAITRERGILQALDAISLLHDVEMVICGPYESAEFEAELRQHKSWPRVRYNGVVGRKAIADILARSRVGLVTLLDSPNQVDSLPVKMFEYMASGTPFVASYFPLWRDIVHETGAGICVNPSSPREIADAIAAILADGSTAEGMGRAGRAFAEKKYNWGKEAQKLISLYESL